jgi:Caspase domain
MENFTAIYVYANGVTLTIGFPSSGVAVYELFKTSSGAQTFYTQVLFPNRRGEVEITFDEGVYGWHVDPAVSISVSTHADVTVSTRSKPSKDPWPTPPPPPPPTKFANVTTTVWNLHYKSMSLRENEFMYSLGGGDEPTGGSEPEPDPAPAPPRGALSMVGVHIAATRRGPAYGPVVAAGELTFPTDMLAVGHRLTHLRGAEYTQFLLGETATRDNVIDAIVSASQRVAAHGVFVLSFAGHGGQMPDLSYDEVDGTDEVWQLYDAFLYDDELGYLLSFFHPSIHCVVIADCCNAAGMVDHDGERQQIAHHWGGPNAPAARDLLPRRQRGAGDRHRRVPSASTALIAATGTQQAKVNTPQTFFGRTLEQLLASGHAPTYRALDQLFQQETSASERANVWCSDERTWNMPPIGR